MKRKSNYKVSIKSLEYVEGMPNSVPITFTNEWTRELCSKLHVGLKKALQSKSLQKFSLYNSLQNLFLNI